MKDTISLHNGHNFSEFEHKDFSSSTKSCIFLSLFTSVLVDCSLNSCELTLVWHNDDFILVVVSFSSALIQGKISDVPRKNVPSSEI